MRKQRFEILLTCYDSWKFCEEDERKSQRTVNSFISHSLIIWVIGHLVQGHAVKKAKSERQHSGFPISQTHRRLPQKSDIARTTFFDHRDDNRIGKGEADIERLDSHHDPFETSI